MHFFFLLLFQNQVRFVIMGNLFCSEYPIHRRFDLKGSSLGRTTDKPQTEIDQYTTLKDLDLNFIFRLKKQWFHEFQRCSYYVPCSTYGVLLVLLEIMAFVCPSCQLRCYKCLSRQVDRDCEFLEQEKIMDYSLLVGVHFIDNREKLLTEGWMENPEHFTCFLI